MVRLISKNKYVPQRGDIVWVNFNPTVGHEQKGRRPALVLSPQSYNIKSGLVIICPVTSISKNYPFEVVCVGKKISGFILSDQIKSVDWQERKTRYVETVSKFTLQSTLDKIDIILKE